MEGDVCTGCARSRWDVRTRRRQGVALFQSLDLAASDPASIVATLSALAKQNFTETDGNGNIVRYIAICVNSQDRAIQEESLRCLNALLRRQRGNCQMASNAGILKGLLSIIDNGGAVQLALECLSLCMRDAGAARVVLREKGTGEFTNLIRATDDPEIMLPCISCISRMLVKAQHDIDSQDLISAVVHVVGHNNAPSVKMAVELAAILFSRSVAAQNIARDVGLVRSLSELLTCGDFGVVRACLQAFVPLMKTGVAYGERSVNPYHIVDLIRCPEVCVQALSCIDWFICGRVGFIPQLVEYGLCEALTALMTDSSYQIKRRCISVIRLILTQGDPEARRACLSVETVTCALDLMLADGACTNVCLSVLTSIFDMCRLCGDTSLFEHFAAHGGQELVLKLLDTQDSASAATQVFYDKYF